MSGTLGFLDVINAQGGTIVTPGLDVVINGTTALAPAFALMLNSGTVVGPGAPVPTLDTAAVAALGSLVVNQGTLAYSINASATVQTTSGSLFVGSGLRSMTITTSGTSAGNVWLNLTNSGTAVVGSGLPIPGGGAPVTFGGNNLPMPLGTVTAISDSGVPIVVSLAGG